MSGRIAKRKRKRSRRHIIALGFAAKRRRQKRMLKIARAAIKFFFIAINIIFLCGVFFML